MAPEQAKVFLAEDDIGLRGTIKGLVNKAGHEVVGEAGTLNGAVAAIEELKVLGVNVAVLDGNLTEEDFSGDDGAQIATALRKEIPGIRIVSLSAQAQTYGDAHVSKGDFKAVVNLGKTINNL